MWRRLLGKYAGVYLAPCVCVILQRSRSVFCMPMSGRPTALYLRPLVVRFTDPAMEDAHIDLVYERVDDDSERHWPRLIELTVGQVKQRVGIRTLT